MNNQTPTAQIGPSDRAIAQAFREAHTMDALHGDAAMLVDRANEIDATTGKTDGSHVFNCRRCPVSVESRWLEPTCPECGDPTELDATAKSQRIELCELHGAQYVRGCAYCAGDLDTLEATQPAAPGAGEPELPELTELVSAAQEMMWAWKQPGERSLHQLKSAMDFAYERAGRAISAIQEYNFHAKA